MDKLDFIREHYGEQINAFRWLIEERFGYLPNQNSSLLRFGGGTALAIYYFQHRKSFDIDLFATDQQVLNYLSPKTWIEESRHFNSSEYIDQAHHVGLLSNNNIKVDILVSADFIEPPLIDSSLELFPINLYVESISDIIAKKIVFRNAQNKTRDIIDIAVALSKDPNILASIVEKGAVSIENIKILQSAINGLNREKYVYETEIVEPFAQYIDIAKSAPEIILEECSRLIENF
ncbi:MULTISPECIES: nucleotidyl transferase AbiEii/AbiGii toxin family protein [unclassified Sulfuricurvum]|uniref:nucleotidyl transferase AbiEii/AbiGii toxin family protein n=1 Tax=unclassified Sulfuricurvum TaxID=2632390 RepID=UPI0002998E99|nr:MULTISPECIES: nucleotidyl transferase AbiEii/AbiGii toxin family protein [unclassified Sulfuricurvum]OHD83184.1 MAG: hypothetical protein A3D90_10930 [Sulfuricurvum sp. RIFCSPHIGHO2_02_FULL_43_9]OHD86659.1 MAG: hypothetical protein A3I60_05835 [Sulfuricurvum sp. RIFCSPLOWO2_02_FULL_43_45]OHD87114.1 MAG: hypothetical protein A2W83_00305 [Sulfuricurvum sp. RIFCSPLOWO2_12_43_5]OHD87741.1 MAG: hypothetical protein A2Y52_00365 [Sulfuricurvum sp. RIFCSPLOWO2_02_43_6]AFV97928.1 hypothetical protei